jgi:hypothetical protein
MPTLGSRCAVAHLPRPTLAAAYPDLLTLARHELATLVNYL